jgi:uncharacterized membrane protein
VFDHKLVSYDRQPIYSIVTFMIYSFLLTSHIICGALVLVLGLIIMLLQPKGNSWHKKLGWIYYLAMCWISLSAVITMIFFKFIFFLFPVAIFSFHLVYSGFRAIKLKHAGNLAWYDWVVAIGTLLFGVGLFTYGIYQLINGHNGTAILSLIFGFFISWSALGDISIYKNINNQTKMWWWMHHMRGMLGGYLAAITAFLVQNGEHIPVIGNSWLIWVLPGAIGGTGLSIWSKYYRRKFAKEATN